VLTTVFLSPFVIGISRQMVRKIPLVQKIKWIYVLIISGIVWLISLNKLGLDTRPGSGSRHERKIHFLSIITGSLLVASATIMMMLKKR
jgi:hypothetical protein